MGKDHQRKYGARGGRGNQLQGQGREKGSFGSLRTWRVHRELLVELDLLGKIEEFREVFRRGADPEAYLRRTIANYRLFMMEAVTKAKKEIEEA